MKEKLPSLYEISNAYNELNNMEDDIDVTECLDRIKADMTTKSTNIIKFIRNKDILVSGIDEEIKRLQGLKKTVVNHNNKLKDYVSFVMQKDDIQKLETPVGIFSFRKSKAVEILDESLIGEEYIKKTIKTSPDKTKIKKALESGENIQGARITYNQNLQIK